MTFVHETSKIAQYIFITNHLQLQVNLQCKLLIVHENIYGRNLTTFNSSNTGKEERALRVYNSL